VPSRAAFSRALPVLLRPGVRSEFKENAVGWAGAYLGVFAAIMAAAVVVGLDGMRRGDRPGDVTISVVMSRFQHPDELCPAAMVTVRNPGPVPVLVGLTVRRYWAPAWLGGNPLIVRVPRATIRGRLWPARQAVVGVLAAGDAGRWLVPVPHGGLTRRVVAVAGQTGGRLRVLARMIEPLQLAA
jgi:hypothetical protein